MIAAQTMVACSDSELVQQCLLGDREAFGRIVSRYQSLICSLAYSAMGSLGQSEDIAQETFIIAWKRLTHLREQHKLRSWLCGIARNRINDALRRDGREPLHHAESLDAVHESVCPEPLPSDQAISEEEAAILWHALEHIPPLYREPLVLFYREHESIETVASHLGLTEDAVKQRLVRGRRLLSEHVLAFVEGALARTKPQKAFTLAVLAALPGLTFSAKAAAVGAVAKSGATAKTAGLGGALGALLGPLIAFIPNYIAYRVTLAGAQSEEERISIKSFFGKVAAITVVLSIPLVGFVLWLTRGQLDRSSLSGLLAGCLVVVFVPTIFILGIDSARKGRRHYSRLLADEYAGVFPDPAWEFCSKAKFLGLPFVHIRIGDRFAMLKTPVKAWIAVGNSAIGGLFAFGGWAIAPISIGAWSIGLLSLGALSLGAISLGGIAVGIWPVFGGLLIGWQAFNGCFAIAWNAAVGFVSVAREFALGRVAHAAQANNELARQFIFPNPLFRCAEFISHHWIWLNLLWIAPFAVMWRMARKQQREAK